jgi:hypothetical protein
VPRTLPTSKAFARVRPLGGLNSSAEQSPEPPKILPNLVSKTVQEGLVNVHLLCETLIRAWDARPCRCTAASGQRHPSSASLLRLMLHQRTLSHRLQPATTAIQIAPSKTNPHTRQRAQPSLSSCRESMSSVGNTIFELSPSHSCWPHPIEPVLCVMSAPLVQHNLLGLDEHLAVGGINNI